MPTEVPTSPQSPQQLARRLAAYIPVTLARQILAEGLPEPGQPRSLTAATLFSDISGFTAMSEELASDGPRGAEEVNRVLLLTFTAMIDIIHQMGGAVSHFYGDAMSVYFPDDDGQAAVRALSCAQQMQQLMLISFERVVTNRPPDKNPFFHLTIKIGVGYGRCQELIVGSPTNGLEFVLTGPAVDEAAAAEKQAVSGQVVAGRAVMAHAGLLATAAFTKLTTPLPIPASQIVLDWADHDQIACSRLAHYAAPFIPSALYQRLTNPDLEILAEHRPVTSMFVQFAFVGDEDPSSAIETAEMGQRLQAYYQWASGVVARFGSENGRVNRVLTGDKGNQLHIMFGAPVAPDAPDQAVRCALALQRECPDYIAAQHIGLAVGKVFAGPVGSDSRREYTVVGDYVNLSARLMQVCDNSQVLTDAITAERCGNSLEFAALTPIHVKGKQITIHPYRAVSDQTTTTQLQAYFGRWERPFIGREEELDRLLGSMDIARYGVGSVVAISGDAGVGKTRLLAEGVEYWLDIGGLGLVGVCHPHTADTPYAPWHNIWHDFFGLKATMEASAQGTAVVQLTTALVPDVGDDVGLWAEVLGLPIPQAEALSALTAEARQARFFTLVQRCFQARATTQPVLLILENIHWADQVSLALVDHLAQQFGQTAVTIALTLRPDNFDMTLDVLQQPICTAVTLADLTPEPARDLLNSLVGARELPPALEQQLGLRDRDGRDSPVNPLFLEEALNVMLDVGVLRRNGRLHINEALLSQMQIPDTIHGLLLARLDRLPPASRDLLQVASVIGRQFGREPLHRITPNMPRAMVGELLDMLSAEEMTRLVTADPEWVYLFQHAMTHEVAYESLPYARRQALHDGLASWLESSYSDNLKPIHPILAYHFSRADAHEKALHYALAAGHDARAIFANADAVELYTLAEKHLQILGVEGWWETAVELYLARSEALRFLGDFNAATEYVDQAIHLAQAHNDIPRMAQAYNLMAELKYRQGRFNEARAAVQQVIDQWHDTITQSDLALAHLWCGLAAGVMLDYEPALTHLRQAEEICLLTRNNERLARVLEGIAFVYFMQQNLEQALVAMQKSVDLSRNFSVPVSIASALNNIALIQAQLGRHEEALATFDEAIASVKEISRSFLAQFLGNKAEVLAYLGKFPESLRAFQDAFNLFVGMDDEKGLAELYLVLAYEYHRSLHEWEAMYERLEQARIIIEERPENYPEKYARLLIGYGDIALHQGDYVQALHHLNEARDIIEEKNFSWWKPIVLYSLARTHLATNHQLLAKELTSLALEAVFAGGSLDYLPLLYLQLAQLEAAAEQKFGYLQESIQSALNRSRYNDKVYCLQEAAKLLLASQEANWQQLGKDCLLHLEALQSGRK
ncbi:MAG: tetratricopeptide repeat protein [Anaerolineales bacterium]|nr:tetratricopeptide repeat protein [Anaerolineales bacterium]